MGDIAAATAPVAKKYLTTADRRTVLIESVQYSWVAKDLMALPECQSDALSGSPTSINSLRQNGFAQLPSPIRSAPAMAHSRMPQQELTVAMLDSRPGFAVDYIATIGAPNPTPTVFRGDTTYLVTGPVVCNGATIIEGGAVFKFKFLSPTTGPSITFNYTVECRTSRYRPAIFTGVDDDSVGESMKNIEPSGYNNGLININGYARPAIRLAGLSGQTLSNLRFTYCQEAMHVYGAEGMYGIVQDSQLVNCIRGIILTGCGSGGGGGSGSGNISVTGQNVLFSRVVFPFTANYTASATLRNCTIDGATRVVTAIYPSSWNIQNSVVANTPQLYFIPTTSLPISFSGSHNGLYQCGFTTLGSSTIVAAEPPFQGFGDSAGFYLSPGHPFRNAGTILGMGPAILDELRLRTVDQPVYLQGVTYYPITLKRTIWPGPGLSVAPPHLGYHYPRLDYIIEDLTLASELILENGVAVGLKGSPSIVVQTGGSIRSTGTAERLNQLVSLANVHEQPVGVTETKLINFASGTGSTVLSFRFTDFSVGQGLQSLFMASGYGLPPFDQISFQDCHFRATTLLGNLTAFSGNNPLIVLKNNLFERCDVGFAYYSHQSSGGNYGLFQCYNNLFWQGNFSIALQLGNQNIFPGWVVKDNFFDGTPQYLNVDMAGHYQFVRTHNAFTTGLINSLGGTHNREATVTYQKGHLGWFYHSNDQLINRGSRSAADAGLYHHTVRVNNLKEGLDPSVPEPPSTPPTPPGQVDIGFHYVALDMATLARAAFDQDEDGMPDYIEDSNGNGLADDLNDWTTFLPDGVGMSVRWMLDHFGHTEIDPLGDFDSDGILNGAEFAIGTDPNTIAFGLNVDNQHVKVSTFPVTVELRGGSPARRAVLVDNSDFANASWPAYSAASMPVNVGSVEGWHDVWVGLKGRAPNSEATWKKLSIKLDRTPPAVVMEGQMNFTYSKPFVQIKGSANEGVDVISYNVTAQGFTRENEMGFVLDAEIDEQTLETTQSSFQLFDVELGDGQNTVTISVHDLAGNITTVPMQITRDYSSVGPPAAPVVTWPPSGAVVAGNSITLRGELEDDTAVIWGKVDDSQGNPCFVEGIVERGGKFWIENLPLNAGANVFELLVTNAAGKDSRYEFSVTGSSLELEAYPPVPAESMYGGVSYISGMIRGDYQVSVNGVEAEMYVGTDGWRQWYVGSVPVIGEGTAVFDIVAVPESYQLKEISGKSFLPAAQSQAQGVPIHHSVNVELPAFVALVSHSGTARGELKSAQGNILEAITRIKDYTANYSVDNGIWRFTYSGSEDRKTEYWSPGYYWDRIVTTWTEAGASQRDTSSSGLDQTSPISSVDFPHDPLMSLRKPGWVGGSGGVGSYPAEFVRHYYARNARNSWSYPEGGTAESKVTANSSMRLFVGGKAKIGGKCLVEIRAGATEYGDAANYEWLETSTTTVDPTRIKVLGWWLFGKKGDANGSVFVALPPNTQKDLNLRVPGVNHYDAWASARAVRLDLKSVEFIDTAGQILQDQGNPYPSPNVVIDPVTKQQTRHAPALYVSGSEVKTTTSFSRTGGDPSGTPFPVIIKGEVSGGGTSFTLPGTGDVGSMGDAVFSTVPSQPLKASKVDFYNPMTIKWYFGDIHGKNMIYAGTSKSPVYVSLAQPQTANLFDTVVHLSCKNARGQTTESGCTQKIWEEFTDRDVRRVDGVQLTYYAEYLCPNTETAGLLATGDGQCGAWAKFFLDMRKIQGIDDPDDYVQLLPINDHGFAVKEWDFVGTGVSGIPGHPYLNIFKDFQTLLAANAYTWMFSEVSDSPGIAGQGNPNPASLFANHQVAIGGKFYDPSSGKTFNTLQEIDDTIAGFYLQGSLLVDEPTVNLDLNNDGDRTDLGVRVEAFVFRRNPPGLDIMRNPHWTDY